MTGYCISAGYSGHYHKKEIEDALLEAVDLLRNTPALMTVEVLKMHVGEPRDDLQGYEDAYKPENNDATIRIQRDEDGDLMVYQSASGGGIQRDIKERYRRAFIRLIIEHMHAKDMDINVSVS